MPEGTSQYEHDRFNNLIAIWVALLSCLLAVANIKGGNVNQAMATAQLAAADTWNQYQAKRLRQFELTGRIAELKARAADARAALGTETGALLRGWQEDEARYKGELTELADKARAHEAEYQGLNVKDDQLDMAQALLALGLALLAVVALTRVRWLLVMALGMGLVGTLFVVAAFVNVGSVHVGWLARLLGA